MPSNSLTEDRRLLIKTLVENFTRSGGRVLIPDGDNDDVLFDSINVSSLIEQIKSSRFIDLSHLYEEPKGDSAAILTNHEQPETTVALNVPQLDVALDEHELQESSFMLFCLYCIKDETDLIPTMRRQLELSESRADDILNLTKRFKSENDNVASMDINVISLLHFLTRVRPCDCQKFRDFVKFRDVTARMLVQVMKESVTGTNLAASAKSEDVPHLIASLKGAVRRLSFTEEADFEEQEYSAAVAALKETVLKMIPFSKSGTAFTWGLRVRLWETLLNSLFEVYDDEIYIEEFEQVKTLLLEDLAPRLLVSPGIHKACFAWVHFRQLSSSGFPGLVPVFQAALKDAEGESEWLEDLDRIYLAEITTACHKYLVEVLMDYHLKLPIPDIVPALVGLFLEIKERRVDVRSLEECVETSCNKAFQRLLQNQERQESVYIQLKNLAESTIELYDTELIKYTSKFGSFCPSAAGIAAKTFHQGFGQELNPVLYELKAIPEDVVLMLKAADKLEDLLMREICQEPGIADSVAPWNVMEQIYDLLFNWVDNQLHKIKQWRERLCQDETWQPQSTSNALSASSIEFKRLLEESITLVFSLDLKFPDDLVNVFVSGLGEALEAYARTTMSDIRGEEGIGLLIPPFPDLTRYKKDLADSAAQQEARSFESKPFKRHSRLKSVLAQDVIMKMVPLIEQSENYQWFNNLKTNALIVRINSLHFLNDSIPELSHMVEKNSHIQGFHGKLDEAGSSRAEPLKSASSTLEYAETVFIRFLSAKIVFWDNRLVWMEQLYRHSVTTSRIDMVFPELYKSLTDINEVALDSIRDKIVHTLLQTCIEAFRRVLLEGGPYRLFRSDNFPPDREMIDEDLRKLKRLFNDEEEGLPMRLIEETVKPVTEVLLQMSLTTANLIQLAEDARRSNHRDLKIYTQILCHRADHAASKWLKKTMKIPKKSKSRF